MLLLILSAVALWNWPELIRKGGRNEEIDSILSILPLLPYALFLVSALMGWRYNNSGLVFSSIILSISYAAIDSFGNPFRVQDYAGLSSFEALTFLLPLNMAGLSLLTKRRLLSSISLICFVIMALQGDL